MRQIKVHVSNKRGFTLVEAIVVLVVLAILAAILIPAMTGWIDKAQAKRCIDEMGRMARDYGACAAQSGYGKVRALDVTACVQEASEDILGRTAGVSGTSYLGTCGNAVTLILTAEEDAVRDAYCPVHGFLSQLGGGRYNGSGVRVVDGLDPEALLKEALDDLLFSSLGDRFTVRYDSTATNGNRTPAILEWLRDRGIDLSALGVRSWSIRNGAANSTTGNAGKRNLYWSDVDVTLQAENTAVRAIWYNEKTGQYAAGYIPVTNNAAGNYKCLGDGTGTGGFVAISAPTGDYQAAVDAFNALATVKAP